MTPAEEWVLGTWSGCLVQLCLSPLWTVAWPPLPHHFPVLTTRRAKVWHKAWVLRIRQLKAEPAAGRGGGCLLLYGAQEG